MGMYLINFSVYTFAMIGILYFAISVYKKTNVNAPVNPNKRNGGMQIEESLSLSPRKRLHVLKVNGQRFLIAADAERTEFLATLDNKEAISAVKPETADTAENVKTVLSDIPKMINPLNFIRRPDTVNSAKKNNISNNTKKSNTINFVKNTNTVNLNKKQNTSSFMKKISPENLNKKLNQVNKGKIAQFSPKLQEKINKVAVEYGSTVLKGTPQKYKTTRLSEVKNIDMKKPPVMRELLRKLAV